MSPDPTGVTGALVIAADAAQELGRRRRSLGFAAEIWAPGNVTVDEQHWTALGGAPSVEHNVIVCYDGGEIVDSAARAGLQTRMPFVMMLAGRALGEAQALMDRDWICTGSIPFMIRALVPGDATVAEAAVESRVRRLGLADLADVHGLVDAAFAIGPELAQAAVPESAVTTPGYTVWGIEDPDGELVSCLCAARVAETVSIWWMSTPPDHRREGHGSRLLTAVLEAAAVEGVRECLLYASDVGEPFWAAMGFEELERWQMWSRPRWMLGRS